MKIVTMAFNLSWVVFLAGWIVLPTPLAAQVEIPGAGENSNSHVDVEMVPSHEAIPAGSSMQIGFQVQVEEGWMIHSNTPSYSLYTPTRLMFEQKAGVTVHSIRYPDGLDRSVPYAGNPFNVYEGTIQILVDLEIDEQLASQDIHLQMMLNYQACDQELCIAPGGVPFRVPLTILSPDEEPVLVNQQRLKELEASFESSGSGVSWRPWVVLFILLIIGWMVAMRVRRRTSDPSA
ncbi:MAG: protein-disulfide reductase DsbD domain-containing protein [Bacteroidota bacterium]